MKANEVTVGISVSNLDEAILWYQRAFELGEPDQIPFDGLVEFDLGAFWLQLSVSPVTGAGGISVNISVESAGEERRRFVDLGLTVSDLEIYEGVVEFFELTDPDGNKVGFVTELS